MALEEGLKVQNIAPAFLLKNMAVHPEGDVKRSVPKAFAYHFQGHPPGQHEGAPGMTEVMDPTRGDARLLTNAP